MAEDRHTTKRAPSEQLATRWYNSLEWRMYLRFAVMLTVMIVGVVWVLLHSGGAVLRESGYRYVEAAGNRLVANALERVAQTEATAYAMARTAEALAADEARLLRVLGETLRSGVERRIIAGGALYLDGPSPRLWTWKRLPDGALRRMDPAEAGGQGLNGEWRLAVAHLPPGIAYWTVPRMDEATGAVLIACATPVYRDGECAGAAVCYVDAASMDAQLERTLPAGDGYAFILDRRNDPISMPSSVSAALRDRAAQPQSARRPSAADLVAAHPAYRPVFAAAGEVNQDIRTQVKWVMAGNEDLAAALAAANEDAPDQPGQLAMGMALDVLSEETRASKLLGRTTVANDPILKSPAVAAVFHVPRAYWKVVLIVPDSLVAAPGAHIAARILITLALVLAIPLIVVLILLRRDLIGPVRHMSRYLMGLTETEGDFLQGLGERAPNELLELANAFNRRTDALRAANAQLRKEIEERVRAEEALRRSEARFRNVLENTRDLLYELNLRTWQYEYISPAAPQVTGFSSEELNRLGARQIADRIHPQDRFLVSTHFKRLIAADGDDAAEETSSQVEYRWRDKSGAYLWASENRTIVRDATGAPLALVGSARDVTERKRSEQEMTRMRHYLQNIINSMPSVIVGVDREGVVTLWNLEAARVTGRDAEEAEGKPFDQVFTLLAEVADRVFGAIRSGEPLESERFVMENKDGELRYHDVIVYPLVANEVEGAVIRVDDVTGRVQIEEMMVQTEKMMSVGGLAAGMAHEINNPLGGILQACQNIDRRTSPQLPKNRAVAEEAGTTIEAVREYIERRGVLEFLHGIRADGARAAKIVADMLAFSRRSESHFAPCRLDDIVETVLRLAANDYDLKKHYDFRRISIRREYGPNLPEVRCDKTKIEQVLLNLIKNAAQAIAEEEKDVTPEITIHIERDGRYVRIEVADNGPGMDENTRRRVFEPFYTTKEVGVGTGLGLSVSYFIITKQHRGAMGVESTRGQGARFIIRLPIDPER